MKQKNIFRFVLTFILPVIFIGIIIGFVLGAIGYYGATFLNLYETEKQYNMIIPGFIILSLILSVGVCIKGLIQFIKLEKISNS